MNTTKLLKTIASLGVTAFLCGCPTTHTQYLPQPRRLAIQGAYVHTASRIVMPETVAGFRRVNVQQYDVDGFDVSAGYNLVTTSRHAQPDHFSRRRNNVLVLCVDLFAKQWAP
jgi:hypothetical protein